MSHFLLRRIVSALGGELEVSARFAAGTVKIEAFNPSGRRESGSRRGFRVGSETIR